MKHLFAAASLFAFLAAAPAFAQQTPSCDSFPSWIERITQAENIDQIDDVMVELGSVNRLGEEGLQSIFKGDLNAAKEAATGILKNEQSLACESVTTPL